MAKGSTPYLFTMLKASISKQNLEEARGYQLGFLNIFSITVISDNSNGYQVELEGPVTWLVRKNILKKGESKPLKSLCIAVH